MKRQYIAPTLELYGSVKALTSSVKCSLGGDQYGTRLGVPGVDFDVNLTSGALDIHNNDCYKLP